MAERIEPRLLGFSLYWAWTLLCFQSTVAFLPWPGLDAVMQGHGAFFTCSLVCTVLAHPLWAWVLWRFPSARVRTPWASAALMSASILAAGVVLGPDGGVALLAAGAVSGVTSALMDVRWSQVYGAQRPDLSGRCIALSIALGIALYFAIGCLGQVSPVASVALLATLPLACAACLGSNARRGEGDDRAASRDVPVTHNARQIWGILWRPVLGSLVFFFAYGCVEGMVMGRVDFNAACGAALAVELVCALALFACLRRHARLSVGGVYGVALALVAAGFMALPLMVGGGAGLFAATVLVSAGTSLFDMLLLCMVAHAAYDYRTPGGIVNGAVRGATVGFSALGHLAGNHLADGLWSGGVDLVVFVLAVSYLLVLSASFFLGRRRLVALPDDELRTGVGWSEVLAPDPAQTDMSHVVGAATGADPLARATHVPVAEAPADAPDRLEDLLDERIERVAFAFHLSRREADVFALIARGRSMPYIAETLVVSENTVRSHTRRIYGKLGVHSKQELLDLVERTPVDPPASKD